MIATAPSLIISSMENEQQPQLNWLTIYKDIHEALKHNQYECSGDAMEKSVKQLQKAHQSAQECASHEWPSLFKLQECYKNISYDLHDHFFRQYYATLSTMTATNKCRGDIYQLVLEHIVQNINVDDVELVEAITAFGHADIDDVNFDLRQIYKNIYDALEQNNYGCFKDHMIGARKFLESVHHEIASCSSNPCLEQILDRIRQHFKRQDEELSGMRCFDVVYDPIRGEIREGLKLKNGRIVDAIKVFGNSSLGDVRRHGMQAPTVAEVAVEISDIDSGFNQPNHENSLPVELQLKEILQYLINDAQNNNFHCIKKIMFTPKRELESYAKHCRTVFNENDFIGCLIGFCN